MKTFPDEILQSFEIPATSEGKRDIPWHLAQGRYVDHESNETRAILYNVMGEVYRVPVTFQDPRQRVTHPGVEIRLPQSTQLEYTPEQKEKLAKMFAEDRSLEAHIVADAVVAAEKAFEDWIFEIASQYRDDVNIGLSKKPLRVYSITSFEDFARFVGQLHQSCGSCQLPFDEHANLKCIFDAGPFKPLENQRKRWEQYQEEIKVFNFIEDQMHSDFGKDLFLKNYRYYIMKKLARQA